MKSQLVVIVAFIMLGSCSQGPREYTINFCTSINSNDECEDVGDTFEKETRVWIMFECNQMFQADIITGELYYYDTNKRIYLDKWSWNIEFGDSWAYDSVDFTERGLYEFVFRNEKHEILARKRITIRD